MEKAAAQAGIFERRRMQQRIQKAVAHVCTSGIGYRSGQTVALYPGCNCLDGQRGKKRGGAIRHDGRIDRLIPGVVRNAGVHQVDRYAFRRDGCAAPGLSHAKDCVGMHRAKRVFQDHAAFDKFSWDF